ncbi:hypothetical protein NPIL_494391 [Nephila pilipes]|uniref:Uncharacterized protein n=1 Tax=Nephila pilipes TaxID=299642 RepID=A0A8X6U0D1_NEPPI|nr:hypothetical protein NPIL_494391 [Nephila pilipes]
MDPEKKINLHFHYRSGKMLFGKRFLGVESLCSPKISLMSLFDASQKTYCKSMTPLIAQSRMQGAPPQILFFAERVNKSAATYQSGPSVLPTITPSGKQSPRRLITFSTHGAPLRPSLVFFPCAKQSAGLFITEPFN